MVVRERLVRDVTGGSLWPTLYVDWSVIILVQLQVHSLWQAAALHHAVPPELARTLAAKNNTKAVWDTLATPRPLRARGK
jgi:hypothetical protein